jgi:hypothetical protein
LEFALKTCSIFCHAQQLDKLSLTVLWDAEPSGKGNEEGKATLEDSCVSERVHWTYTDVDDGDVQGLS